MCCDVSASERQGLRGTYCVPEGVCVEPHSGGRRVRGKQITTEKWRAFISRLFSHQL